MATIKFKNKASSEITSNEPQYFVIIDDVLNLSQGWSVGGGWSQGATGLVATLVSPGGVTSKNIAGVFENHLYKVTIVIDSTDQAINFSLGNNTFITGSAPGTIIGYVRPNAGNLLSLTNGGAGDLTAVISSIDIEALDAFNPNLLPDS